MPVRAHILVAGLSVVVGGAGLVAFAPAALAARPAQETTPVPARSSVPARSAALAALLDDYVEFIKDSSPTSAWARGDERFAGKLGDYSLEGVERQHAQRQDFRARLAAIERAGFTEDDAVDADLLAYELDLAIAGHALRPDQMPLNQQWGLHTWLPQMYQSLPLHSERDLEHYVALLEQAPAAIDHTIAALRRGLEAGRVPPRLVMAATPAQARAQATEAIRRDPALSPMFTPLRGRPEGDALAARARKAIGEGVAPALLRLADFLEREYLPRCRESTGISEGIDGPAAYDHALRVYTTTNMTAREVHELGLREVARIRAEMFEVIARTDWPDRAKHPAGSDEQFKAFVGYLRTDPRFYHTSAEDLLRGYRDISKRVDAELPRLFRVLPQNPYGVREMPAFMAPTSPTAYYYPGSLEGGVPGYFVANTHRLDQRPKYEMIALTLHEAVPGHHLQIALQTELEGVHEVRRWTDYTVFAEGWALYAERLGLEMGDGAAQHAAQNAARNAGQNAGQNAGGDAGFRGLYADPYDDFGRLTYEMWRACRLVVDPGLHALGWTRQQAIDFMLANSALSPLNIEREVDRYIGWPGQATAYKVGELKIRELRARAERTLGERFDIREFHDVVLSAGAIPLGVLEARVDRWIASRAAPAATGR